MVLIEWEYNTILHPQLSIYKFLTSSLTSSDAEINNGRLEENVVCCRNHWGHVNLQYWLCIRIYNRREL